MPGMQSGLDVSNPLVAAAFKSALRHQLFAVAAIFVLLWLARLIAASWWPARGTAGDTPQAGDAPAAVGSGLLARLRGTEPAGRAWLRIGFGLLWVFDGILQAQPSMPLGLAPQVIEPSASASPSWVQHLVNWAGTFWTYHPVAISAATVWIQVGIGLWLLFAKHGSWLRAAALASVGWGLVVWMVGESFGGIFAPGLTWLFGAPGAAVFYCAAGALLALPEAAWHTRRLGRLMLAGMGAFFVLMAVLQAWPGRGFWQGRLHGQAGPLTGMIQSMSQTSQPHVLAAAVSGFATFVAAHGFAVNLFVVIMLAAIGSAFLSGRPRLAGVAVGLAVAACLADWLLIEDLGFLGGLGTDPNSMIPMALLFVSGYLIMTQAPGQPEAEQARQARQAPQARQAAQPQETPAAQGRWRPRALGASAGRSVAMASARSIAAVGAVGVTLLGVVPAIAATANPNADPIIAQAIDGSASTVNLRAAAFTLTDQRDAPVSLASLRGKVLLLTFLDPVCTSDCPVIGREFAEAAGLLSADSRRVELAAIVLNPTYRSQGVIRAFDQEEGLGRLPNWLYLTGTLPQLQKVWRAYGVTAQNLPGGAMTLHSDLAYAIDGNGHVRQVLNAAPGPGTAASKSSFAGQLAAAARRLLSSR